MPEPKSLSAEETRDRVCEALAEAKATDLLVLEVKNVTVLADYFILATATSTVHGAAIGRNVRETMKREHRRNCVPEGHQDSNWIILDYGDVVAHVQSAERREFYSLDKLWSKAKAYPWEDTLAPPATSPSEGEVD